MKPENEREIYSAVVIGCGRIGSEFSQTTAAPGIHSHAAAFDAHRRTRLVGVADTDAAKLDSAARFWQTEKDSDAVNLCRRLRPDIISICTPDATHFDLSRRILHEAAPRVLFVEKPMTLNSAEADELLALAKTKNCAVAVNYSRRFSLAVRALKRELEDGVHGKPLLARMIYGKGLFHNGSHALDLLRFWLGEVVEFDGKPEAAGLGADETFSVNLRFANGCRARLDAFDEQTATVFELDFLTEKTRWRFWLGGARWEFSAVAPSPTHAGYFNYLPTGREKTDALFVAPLADCLSAAAENIVNFLDGTEQLLCSGADGWRVIKLIEEIRRTR